MLIPCVRLCVSVCVCVYLCEWGVDVCLCVSVCRAGHTALHITDKGKVENAVEEYGSIARTYEELGQFPSLITLSTH